MALIYIDGVMFDEEQTTLLHCPATTTGVYKVPSTVKKIGIQAFFGCSRLLTVQLPRTPNYTNRTRYTIAVWLQ